MAADFDSGGKGVLGSCSERYPGLGFLVVLRKATEIEDPSGDDAQYAEKRGLDINGTSVMLKGEKGQYILALQE